MNKGKLKDIFSELDVLSEKIEGQRNSSLVYKGIFKEIELSLKSLIGSQDIGNFGDPRDESKDWFKGYDNGLSDVYCSIQQIKISALRKMEEK